MNNFDTVRNIENRIDTLINQAINNLPKSLPCRVESVEKNVLKAVRLINTGNVIGFVDSIPIIRSIYSTYPIKKGDIGVLITCDYPISSYIENSKLNESEMLLNSNGAGYMFLPLASNDVDLIDSVDGFEFHSINNEAVVKINDDNIEIKYKDSSILIKDDILIENKENNIIINDSGISIECKNGNVIELGTSSVKINGNLEIMQ